MLEFLVKAIGQDKETKVTWIGNEKVQLSLFADNMIIHEEKSKESKKCQ